ncbi:hypothetical protein OUZ56_011318 [Daphnia magna]|uniref:Uncharacterized protein n=1 Tax=Daphnia magna TaxID=35525 RepID=A0ABQ9YZT5_9CRUS|nr:hypothetical protein OUZ56_011318 [Daphnia magna]
MGKDLVTPFTHERRTIGLVVTQLMQYNLSDKRTTSTAGSNSRRGTVIGLRDAIRPLAITKLRLADPLHLAHKYATAPNTTDDASANMTRRKIDASNGKSTGRKQRFTQGKDVFSKLVAQVFHFASISTGKGLSQHRDEEWSNICVS